MQSVLIRLALLATLFISIGLFSNARYSAGYKAAELKAQAAQLKAENERRQMVTELERRVTQSFVEKQKEIEKERDDAKREMDSMRSEFGRLQQHIATQRSRAVSAGNGTSGKIDETSAAGWTLFGKCAVEYAGMAEVADAQRNDLAEWQAYAKSITETK